MYFVVYFRMEVFIDEEINCFGVVYSVVGGVFCSFCKCWRVEYNKGYS